MLGEVVDEIIYGDVRFLQGTVAIVAIAGLAYTDSWLATFPRLQGLLEGTPTVVVRNGEFERRGMRREHMTESDILGHLRTEGISDMREVRLAIVENDGTVSVLKHAWALEAQRADVLKEEQAARRAVVGGQEEPPEEKNTTSPKALGS
jgi:uncharacterized membrane protein YcaP (DUF421 family)